MSELPGAFEDWLRRGAPDPAGEVDTVQGVENSLQAVIGLTKIYHQLLANELDGLRDLLGDDVPDECQNWVNDYLSDLLTDCGGMIERATEDAAPHRTMHVIKYPDFTALTLADRVKACPVSNRESNIKRAALAAPLSSGNGEGL